MKKAPPAKKPAANSKPAQPATAKTKATQSGAFTELRSLEEIKEFIEFAAAKQFDEIELERGDFRLRLRKGGASSAAEASVQSALLTAPQVIASPPAETVAPLPAVPPVAVELPAEEDLHILTSPIVGTFYRSSAPTTEPFVKTGDSIEAGQTMCIVEAMKLMNEIQSDVSGAIVKIFVENAQPVEYGQPLFGIKM